MKISLQTFGCKLNYAETDELKKDLLKQGRIVVPIESGEDVAIVRGCAVTMGASRSTREMIRRLKRAGARVIAVGCLENSDLPEIDFVGRNNEEVIKYLNVIARSEERTTKQSPADAELQWDRHALRARDDIVNRTRAFIKIQNGCNFNCAYCIIQTFRGRAESVPAEEVIRRIEEAENEGYKEVVLTGVNICQYRHHPLSPSSTRRGQDVTLAGLLKKILEETNVPRIRLGSLDPRLVTDEMIEVFTAPDSLLLKEGTVRLMPHWHLSLQSGSDEIIKKMNRLYTAKQYEKIVTRMREANPLFSLTTDIIVGFPGETDENFRETCEFVKKIGFAKVHIFPFSPRPGTAAMLMSNQVPDKIKKERVKKLKEIADIATAQYAKKFIGENRAILFENKTRAGRTRGDYWEGYTPEYVRVKIKSEINLQNKLVSIEMTPNNTGFPRLNRGNDSDLLINDDRMSR